MEERYNGQRSLYAIVYTDIVGYSAIMQDDEGKARNLRTRHKSIFKKYTGEHHGKILQYYGDGTLSIFKSAVEAVECAAKMQVEFQSDPKVPLRIGIHLGDISFDDEDAYGDGMNIASRVERICISGGIFISKKVNDEIINHKWLKTRSLGSFKFKNIRSEIPLYAVSNDHIVVPPDNYLNELTLKNHKAIRQTESSRVQTKVKSIAAVLVMISLAFGTNYLFHKLFAHPEEMVRMETGKKSIAVLPFDNLSDVEGNQYFSDGITEDILTLLSKIDGLDVVSRTSVVRYKGTKKTIPEIARELGTDHILEGTVRRSGNKVRVTATLIDARNDSQIWSSAFDKEITEIFEVQSELANSIASALETQLSDSDILELKNKPTRYVNAYDKYLKGRDYYRKYTADDNEEAITLFKNAINIDSTFALAYAGLGDAFSQKSFRSTSSKALLDSAIMVSQKSIALEPDLSEGHKALGLAYHYLEDSDKALDSYFTALKFNPKNDMAGTNISSIYMQEGKYVESIDWAKKTLKMDPTYVGSITAMAGKYMKLQMNDEAKSLLTYGIELHPDHIHFYQMLGNIELSNHNYDDAGEYASKVFELDPENEGAHQLLAKKYAYEGDLENSKNHFEQVKKHKNNDVFTKAFAKTSIAFIDFKMGKEEESIREMELILSNLKERGGKFKKVSKIVGSYIQTVLSCAKGEQEQALSSLDIIAENDLIDYKFFESTPFFDCLEGNKKYDRFLTKAKNKIDSIQLAVRTNSGRVIL